MLVLALAVGCATLVVGRAVVLCCAVVVGCALVVRCVMVVGRALVVRCAVVVGCAVVVHVRCTKVVGRALVLRCGVVDPVVGWQVFIWAISFPLSHAPSLLSSLSLPSLSLSPLSLTSSLLSLTTTLLVSSSSPDNVQSVSVLSLRPTTGKPAHHLPPLLSTAHHQY